MNDDHRTPAASPATALAARPAPRYVRPDPDHACCLRCWTAARLRSAREAAREAARLAHRQQDAWAALGLMTAVVAVLGVVFAAAAVIGAAWLRLGEMVLGGGN
jgi:hypothetical protein